MRVPDRKKTLMPNTVIVKRSGEVIELDTPEMVAIVTAIAEDFMQPMANGLSDVVSAAVEARTTLAVLKAAGLKAVDDDVRAES